MDLVEKVARAICLANCDNPDEESLGFLSDNVTGHAWEGYVPHANAAIAATNRNDMLHALRSARARLATVFEAEGRNPRDDATVREIDAAIAKAEGV